MRIIDFCSFPPSPEVASTVLERCVSLAVGVLLCGWGCSCRVYRGQDVDSGLTHFPNPSIPEGALLYLQPPTRLHPGGARPCGTEVEGKTPWFLVGNGGMDPYRSSLNDPFPLRTREKKESLVPLGTFASSVTTTSTSGTATPKAVPETLVRCCTHRPHSTSFWGFIFRIL